MATDAVPPKPSSRKPPSPSSLSPSTTASTTLNSATAAAAAKTSSSSSSLSSRASLSSLRSSLPENPHLYDMSEIRAATNNFLAKNFSPSSSSSSRCWRCNLQGKDVMIFQRKSHIQLRPPTVRQKLSSICKSHHVAIVNLLGASISGDYVYLVYDFVPGGNLHDLLHNSHNPDFTVLNTWMSRVQIASDLANGLDYIHNNTALDVKFVHNHIKSSSVVVTEPLFNGKICHFGAAELCGEPTEERESVKFHGSKAIEEIISEDEDGDKEDEEKVMSSSMKLIRSNSVKFNGTRGCMSPEFQATGVGTRKSDVYAFGVVLVELLSGEEPVKYKYDKAAKEYVKIAAVDAARGVVEDGGEGRLRKWVDKRLKDSYPVEVAVKLTRLAVDCVHVDPNKRPDMRRVAGKISKLYLESQAWCERMRIPTEISASFAAR